MSPDSQRIDAQPSIEAANANNGGLTLIEIVISFVIIATIAAIAIPSYIHYRDKAKIAVAMAEIHIMGKRISQFELDNDTLPDTLSDAELDHMRDPWGTPYQYLKIEGANLKGKGTVRRDRNLNPVNTDYDLYSMGKDQKTSMQFSAKKARDDVVRANNGSFVGLAQNY